MCPYSRFNYVSECILAVFFFFFYINSPTTGCSIQKHNFTKDLEKAFVHFNSLYHSKSAVSLLYHTRFAAWQLIFSILNQKSFVLLKQVYFQDSYHEWKKNKSPIRCFSKR